MIIDIHADDYALTLNTSIDILKCLKAGKLDSISIIPNTSCFDECMEMLYGAIPELPYLPLMSIHINLVEGVPLFNGLDGVPKYECLSWGHLYMYSWLLGKNNPIRKSIKEEVLSQVVKCQHAIERCITIAKDKGIRCRQTGVRIDSHQHTHMIPMVWDSCLETCDILELNIEYIRNSHEPICVFLKNRELRHGFRLANIAKNRILAIHSYKADKLSERIGLNKMYLWGLIMSGNMDIKRVSKLYQNVKESADKKGRMLEILFHPGTVLASEINEELNHEAVICFYLNNGRKNEMETVMNYEFNRE